jgi:hypothetical protein
MAEDVETSNNSSRNSWKQKIIIPMVVSIRSCVIWQMWEAMDPSILQVFNSMHKSPIGHAQKLPQANILFVGDANHPISPFSGNGANVELSSCTSIRTAIGNFGADSAPRWQKATNRGRVTITLLHTQGVVFFALRLS